MASYVNEKKNEKATKRKKSVGDMMVSHLSTKSGITSLAGYRENRFHRRTDAERPRHAVSSADTVKES